MSPLGLSPELFFQYGSTLLNVARTHSLYSAAMFNRASELHSVRLMEQ